MMPEILCLTGCDEAFGALSLVAVHYGRTVLAEDPDEVAVTYARTGMTIGVVSAVYSGLMLMMIAAYIMLYVGMIALVVVAEGL